MTKSVTEILSETRVSFGLGQSLVLHASSTHFLQVGVPVNTADRLDVYQENEELKEELQKLAAKVTRNTCKKRILTTKFPNRLNFSR